MSSRDLKDFGEEIREPMRLLRGMIRRLVVTLSDSTRWQFLGQRGGTGGDEVISAEPFTGIGFYSRPPATGKPEAVAAAVAGSRTMLVVATRDEATRQVVVNALNAGEGLAEDETIVYSGAALIHIRANGTVEIRTPGGAAVPLATLADVQAIRTALHNHSHTYIPGSNTPTTTTGNPSVPAPNGTTVLKGQ